MIEGIQIRVTSDQLREHYAAKVAECRKWFDFFSIRVTALEHVPEDQRSFQHIITFSGAQCRKAEFEHKGQLFEKLLAHLIEGETYSFTYKEASELELLPANVALIREEKPGI